MRFGFRHLVHLPFPRSTFGRDRARFECSLVSDAIQPTREGVALVNRRRPPCQDEKSGLKRVLGVVSIVEDAAANAEHHRTVSAHQARERRLLACGDEAAQQLAILLADGGCDRASEEVDDPIHRQTRHIDIPRQSVSPP